MRNIDSIGTELTRSRVKAVCKSGTRYTVVSVVVDSMVTVELSYSHKYIIIIMLFCGIEGIVELKVLE